jgi:cell division protease FtsH
VRNLSRLNVFWLVLVLAVLFLLVVPNEMSGRGPEEVPFSVLMQKVDDGHVREVTIAGQSIKGKFDSGTAFVSTGPELTEGIYNNFVEHGVTPNFEERDDQAFLWNLGFMLLPVIAMVGLFVWFMRSLQGHQRPRDELRKVSREASL